MIVVGFVLFIYLLFYSVLLEALLPSSQISNTWSLILTNECLALAWLVASLLFLS